MASSWSRGGGGSTDSASSSSTSPTTTARCPKKWFPPATFQLRLRAVRSLTFVVPDGEPVPGPMYVTLHLGVKEEPFYHSPPSSPGGWDKTRVTWEPLAIPVKYSGCPGCVVKVRKADNENVVFTGFIHLNGMPCLGVHLPPLVRSSPALVFYMAGSYFLAGGPVSDLRKHLFIGPFQPNQVLESYSASLLIRLLRLHRAMTQQAATNENFKESLERRGLCDSQERFDSFPLPKPKASGKALFFDRLKEPSTRMAETQLREKVEQVRMRVHLYKAEKAQLERRVAKKWASVNALQREIDEVTGVLMDRLHNFARDKQGLQEWRLRQLAGCQGVSGCLERAAQAAQYSILSSLKVLYPVQNPLLAEPTIRWVSLPPLDRARSNSRQETALAVTLGWVAHALCTASAVLDVPLRYPVVYRGSMSVVVDLSKGDRREQQEFPLYTQNMELARADYGLFLLNKNLAQFRWLCGLVTSDLKCTLKNLHELLSLGDQREQQQSQHQLKGIQYQHRHRMPPPSSPPLLAPLSSSSPLHLLSPPPRAGGDKSQNSQTLPPKEEPSNGTTMPLVPPAAAAVRATPATDIKKSASTTPTPPSESPVLPVNNSAATAGSWGGEFASRTKALSIPTTFQRKKTQQQHQELGLGGGQQSSHRRQPW